MNRHSISSWENKAWFDWSEEERKEYEKFRKEKERINPMYSKSTPHVPITNVQKFTSFLEEHSHAYTYQKREIEFKDGIDVRFIVTIIRKGMSEEEVNRNIDLLWTNEEYLLGGSQSLGPDMGGNKIRGGIFSVIVDT